MEHAAACSSGYLLKAAVDRNKCRTQFCRDNAKFSLKDAIKPVADVEIFYLSPLQ